MKKSLLILILISTLSFFLTFFLLGKNPPSINTDEAAIGYNALSILKTGRDEYGQFFPIAFRSFDDYKPPLYIYLTVPSVALFGLNEFSVRLPAAVMGVLSVIFTYLLVRKLFKKEKIALLAAFLLAISPWHLFFTRTAYETGSLAFFSSAGAFFFLKGREKNWYFLISALFFGASPFIYQAAKVFTPLLLGTLFLIYFLPIKLNLIKKSLIIILFVFALFPSFLTLISAQGSTRFRGISIFSDPRIATADVEQKRIDWLGGDNKSTIIFHSAQGAYIREAMIGYLKHFRPDFLFFDFNDSRLPYIPNQGLLYLFELPFLIFGLYTVWNKFDRKAALFLFAWVLIAPIPTAVVPGDPSSIRFALIMPALDILIAVGIYSFFKNQLIKPKLLATAIAIVVVTTYSLAYFEHMLFVHAPFEHSRSWYYSYKQVVEESAKLSPKYKKIIVSNSLDQPYIFFLFYLENNPEKYLTGDGGTVSGGFSSNENHLGKYQFKFIDWPTMSKEKNTLFIGLSRDFPSDLVPFQTFHYLNGEPSVIFLSR